MPNLAGLRSLISNKLLLTISLLLFLIISTLLISSYLRYQKDNRSKASKSARLYFTPASTNTTPILTNYNENFDINIMVDPQQTLISLVRFDISYDPEQLALDETTPIKINQTVFTSSLEGPIFSPGRIQGLVSIGSDPTKAISSPAAIATLKFKPITRTGNLSQLTFNPTNTMALSVGPQDETTENVLGTLEQAFIALPAVNATGTPVPTSTIPSPTPLDANCPGITPGATPLDIMLLIDNSGSMRDKADSADLQTKLEAVKHAAKLFTDKFAGSTNTRIGLVVFADTQTYANSPVTAALTNDFAAIKSSIDSINTTSISGTCLECGLHKANGELAAHGRPSAKKVFVLLTDGLANATIDQQYVSSTNPGQQAAEEKAMDEARNIYNQSRVSIYSIGIGADVNNNFLQLMANETGAKYYFAPSSTDLDEIYTDISRLTLYGSVTGMVYNDANRNKTFDSNEQKLSGWTIKLKNQSGDVIATAQSSANGLYVISNLCDGTYTVSEDLQNGWVQTIPVNPDSYSVTIVNGSAIANKDFGNSQATNNDEIKADLSVFLHGIGNSGDNVNPNSSLSNKNPLHPIRPVKVELYNSNEVLIATKEAQITYASSSGNFKGSVNLGSINAGNYLFKIKSGQYLRKTYPGFQTLQNGTDITLPAISLTTGDTNDDNKLNILDYNIIYGCFTGNVLTQPRSCTADQKLMSDLDDNGPVNLYDFNLYIRELSVQYGT